VTVFEETTIGRSLAILIIAVSTVTHDLKIKPCRTLAYQEILRIGPHGKLGHFESTAEFFVYIASISLASGPILSITSWFAKVLHD